jgi:hypothetical protein
MINYGNSLNKPNYMGIVMRYLQKLENKKAKL